MSCASLLPPLGCPNGAGLQPRMRLLTDSAGRYRSRPSRLLQHAVLLAEVIAREHVEIGAGDADHPGLVRMRGRMDHPGAIGFGLSRPEAIPAHRLQNRMRLALRVGTAPLGHLGILPRVAVDRPRRAMAVRLADLFSFLHVL